MGASRLKPLTIKEVEKLTTKSPTTIKHRSLGGVPGFVLLYTPVGHTSTASSTGPTAAYVPTIRRQPHPCREPPGADHARIGTTSPVITGLAQNFAQSSIRWRRLSIRSLRR